MKQYKFDKHKTATERKQTIQASTSSSSEVSMQQYDAVTQHMEENFNEKVTKRKVPPKAKEESPEQQAFKRAKGAYSTSLRKCKKVIDGSSNSMKDWMAKAQMITKKGYPEAMQSFMISKISELQGQNGALHGLYMQEQGKAEAKHESQTETVESNTRKVDEAVKAMRRS